ncbi:MAG: hypothetical protein HDT22_09575 [Ruminococcus sp.]|nr:hypothetical protein [Ruminococcus sp.]
MLKNILVMDTTGRQIGSTYPKRAKGLIKHNRAILINEFTIQLKGVSSMSAKEALLAVVNEMSESQTTSLLTFLNTFSANPTEINIPTETKNVRSEMIQTLQKQIEVLAKDNYASPNAVDVLKELKDMLNMILRSEN